MFRSTALATAICALSATGSVAQSSTFSGDGFYIHGYVDLSYFDEGTFNETFLFADIDLGFNPTDNGSAVPIGFSLAIDAITDLSDEETQFSPAITFGFGNHLISAGNPRSVLDRGYLSENMFAESAFVNFEFSPLTGSYLSYVQLFSDETAYGLRYDGDFGNTKIGASYHRMDISGDVNFYGLAVRHEVDAISSLFGVALFGGLEHLETSGTSETRWQIGAEGGTDQLKVGFTHVDDGAIAVDRYSEAFLRYNVSDSFTLGADVGVLDFGGPSDTIYGLSAEYRFMQNGYVNASYLDGAFGDSAYELSVGYRF